MFSFAFRYLRVLKVFTPTMSRGMGESLLPSPFSNNKQRKVDTFKVKDKSMLVVRVNIGVIGLIFDSRKNN